MSTVSSDLTSSGALVSARGLQNDERRGVPIQTLDQRLDACPIIDYSPAVT